MKWPTLLSDNGSGKVVVYPKFAKGNYKISNKKNILDLRKGLIIDVNDIQKLEFTSTNSNSIPSRIVTGIQFQKTEKSLPLECSMGIVHEKRPPKRFHWAVISKKFSSTLYFNSYEEIYEVPDSIFLVFRLYTQNSLTYSELRLDLDSISDMPESILVADLFGKDQNYDSNCYGYISMFSNYGGLYMYSSMQKKNSMTIEHSF